MNKKIVMLCEFYNEHCEYQENLLAKYYTKHNHQVTIITSTFDSVFDYYADRYDNSSPSKVYFDNEVKIIKLRYSFNIINRLRKYKSIYKILESEKPDLIYIHDIMLNILEAVKYKKKNLQCKIIMDYHADYSNSAKNWLSMNILHKIIRKTYLDISKKYIERFFPVVPASAKFLNEVYKIPYERMELLPLGADIDFGKKVKQQYEGAKIRKKYGIKDSDIAIFTGGKLSPTKKTELLIKAFKEINRSDLHLFIIGDAGKDNISYHKKLQDISKENSRINFMGWLKSSDIYRFLDASDIAVFPASQSIIWQQAISMGLPLLVGDIGHQSISYLNQYRNIVILNRGEIKSSRIAEEILKIINDPIKIVNMKNGAKKTADELLNWNKLILKTLQFNK
jgi:1,2-diacylglycerol 3-alpha-glucosyltransferase